MNKIILFTSCILITVSGTVNATNTASTTITSLNSCCTGELVIKVDDTTAFSASNCATGNLNRAHIFSHTLDASTKNVTGSVENYVFDQVFATATTALATGRNVKINFDVNLCKSGKPIATGIEIFY